MPTFTNIAQLHDYIQQAVKAETMKLTAPKPVTQPRYGPVVLTPNPDSIPVEENTPRSTATTRPAVGTKDEDRNGQEEYHPPTVESCLYEAYNFEKDFRERTAPPFPEDEYKGLIKTARERYKKLTLIA